MKRRIVSVAVAALFIVSLFAGCAKNTAGAFDGFTDRMFKELVVGDAITCHYILAHPEEAGVTDIPTGLGSYRYTDEDYGRLEGYLKELEKYPYEELSAQQQVTHDVLKHELERELAKRQYDDYVEDLSPTVGLQAQLPVTLVEYTLRTKEDVENYLILIADLDRYFGEVLDHEKAKSEKGLFMSDRSVDDILEQMDSFMENPDENVMIVTFPERLNAVEGLSEEEKAAFTAENEKLVKENVLGAYRKLRDGLAALKGTGKNEGGLAGYEGGREYYASLAAEATGSSRSVEEMKALLEELVETNMTEMVNVMMKNPDCLEEMMSYAPTLTDPTAMVEDLRGKIGASFPEPPETAYTIKTVNESLESFLSPAFYMIPPADDYRNNSIYINESEQYEAMDIYTTLAHEAYPGHLYQNVYFSSTGAPYIRHLFSFAGYSEGWATYVEHRYAYDYSERSEDVAKMDAANNLATLALHGIIDIGVNYEGWTREELSQYMAGFFEVDDELVDTMYTAMVEEPGNYLSYVVGCAEFLELREKAEETLGGAFSEKEFHRFLLETGPVPFPVLEKHMESWMEGVLVPKSTLEPAA